MKPPGPRASVVGRRIPAPGFSRFARLNLCRRFGGCTTRIRQGLVKLYNECAGLVYGMGKPELGNNSVAEGERSVYGQGLA